MNNNNKTILVVEDDIVASIVYKFSLESMGYDMVGPITTIEEALSIIEKQQFCAALLDIDLDGEKVTPVAERLSEIHCPFIFITGYSNILMLPDKYHDFQFLEKPVKESELKDALATIGLTDIG